MHQVSGKSDGTRPFKARTTPHAAGSLPRVQPSSRLACRAARWAPGPDLRAPRASLARRSSSVRAPTSARCTTEDGEGFVRVLPRAVTEGSPAGASAEEIHSAETVGKLIKFLSARPCVSEEGNCSRGRPNTLASAGTDACGVELCAQRLLADS